MCVCVCVCVCGEEIYNISCSSNIIRKIKSRNKSMLMITTDELRNSHSI